uniref:Uncharacterized protein n=1 Tax=Arundo donax TaxID=35708 RepID=A0A0A9FP76_ARUDO
MYPSPPPAPCLFPPRRRLQAPRRQRRGGRERLRLGLRERAHQPRAVRALHLAALQGCGHGNCAERCHGERLDNGIRYGGSTNGEQSQWGG